MKILEQNIHNLAYAQYEGVGDYDIPMMLPVHIDGLADIPIQGFNFALKESLNAVLTFYAYTLI